MNNRKEETVKLLKELLNIVENEGHPDFEYLRFGQLLLNVTKRESVLYNIESLDLLKEIKNYLQNNNLD